MLPSFEGHSCQNAKITVFPFKRCGVYLISGLLGAAFISKNQNKRKRNPKSVQNNKIFLKPCSVKLLSKDVKYDLLSLSSNKQRFFRVDSLINAAFEHLKIRRL